MGEVYAAVDTRLDRTVAIKILPEHLADDPQVRERFEREARAVGSLNHPHICTLFDVGEQDGVHFLVMELVEGETLAARLAGGRLGLDHALEYAIQIADALDKAHRQGMVHRDLKPANIMITKSGTKLLDFGLAKLGVASPTTPLSELQTQDEAKPQSTAEGAIIGTLEYMAPEQLDGKETDARTDIFAFGAVVYEMVTGKRPFTGETQAGLIGAILKDEPESMAEFLSTTPASLDHAIGRCLHKDPDQRWQTAADLMHELRWVRAAEPATLEEPGPGTRRRSIAVALTILAAGALITAVAIRDFGPAPAGEETRLMLGLPEGTHLGNQGLGDRLTSGRPTFRAVAMSPDGKNLVYVGNDGEGTQLYLRHLDQYQAVPIPGTEGAEVADFSPDGRSIAFIRRPPTESGAELMRIPLGGGETRTIATSSTGLRFFPNDLSWTDDNRILLGSREGIVQVSANGGDVTHLTTHDRGRGYVQHTRSCFRAARLCCTSIAGGREEFRAKKAT